MYINGRQISALTFAGQRKCGAVQYCYTERSVVRCHCSEYRRTGYWNMYSMMRLTIWQMAVKNCHGQMSSSLCRNYSMCKKKVSGTKMINFNNSSWSNCIIIVQICAVIHENVSGTKMCYFDNCERFREMRGNESRGVYQRRICYTPRIAESSFRTTT